MTEKNPSHRTSLETVAQSDWVLSYESNTEHPTQFSQKSKLLSPNSTNQLTKNKLVELQQNQAHLKLTLHDANIKKDFSNENFNDFDDTNGNTDFQQLNSVRSFFMKGDNMSSRSSLYSNFSQTMLQTNLKSIAQQQKQENTEQGQQYTSNSRRHTQNASSFIPTKSQNLIQKLGTINNQISQQFEIMDQDMQDNIDDDNPIGLTMQMQKMSTNIKTLDKLNKRF